MPFDFFPRDRCGPADQIAPSDLLIQGKLDETGVHRRGFGEGFIDERKTLSSRMVKVHPARAGRKAVAPGSLFSEGTGYGQVSF